MIKFPITPKDAANRMLSQFNAKETNARLDALEDAVKELQEKLADKTKKGSA